MSLPLGLEVTVQAVSAFGGVGGAVAALLYRSQKRKLSVDTERARVDSAQVLSEASLALLEPYRQQIKDLEADLKEARHQVHTLAGQLSDAQGELQQLRNQVTTMSKELDAVHGDQQRQGR